MSDSSLAPIRNRVIESIRRLLWRAAPGLFDDFVQPYTGQRFAIGIYAGSSILDLRQPAGVRNPVLSCADVNDAPAAFVADPFMIRREGAWHMLFEVMNHATRRGQIALASSADGINWRYQGTVLREPFHLAYPQMFEYDGVMYLVPDSPGNGIRLYRAERFPGQWKFVRELRSDNSYSDATLFQFGDLWWMYVAWSPNSDSAKSLRLFHADDPTGEWREHPASPLITANDRTVRPAGSVSINDGRLVRLAQECEPTYGLRVHAFEVLELTLDSYAERPLCKRPILDKGCAEWHLHGMHHADIHSLEEGGFIACVDGWHQVRYGQGVRETS